MSSILKALKRLENENAARKPEYIKIDAEILKSASSRRVVSVGVIFAACALFLSGGFASYFFLKHELSPASAVKSPIPAQMPGSEPSPATLSAPDTGRTVNLQTPSKDTLRENGVPVSMPATSRQQSVLEKDSEPAPKTAHTPETKTLPLLPAVPVVAPPAKQAVLKVDGIAFQEGAADSLAVVNGTTVSKGSVIEGVRVEEIQKDRVKFSRGGEKFEVILDKSN